MATKRPSSSTPDCAFDPSRATQLLVALDSYMSKQGLRSTEQRRVIVDTFVNAKSHLTIEELLALVKQRDPRIGYATVYRTLKMLAESGIANELHFGDNFARYELSNGTAHHDHLICTLCGAIVEFEEPAIEELQRRIAERHGFVVDTHRHELYGTCAQCRSNDSGKPPSSKT